MYLLIYIIFTNVMKIIFIFFIKIIINKNKHLF